MLKVRCTSEYTLTGGKKMAAVEKRKAPWIALIGNHMMFSVLAFFVVLNMPTGGFQIFVGVVLLLLYLFGVYDYSNRDGIEHKKSYSKVEPSFKYPIYHGLIALAYFLVPVLITAALVFNLDWQKAAFALTLFINAQFEFTLFLNVIDDGLININWYITSVFSLLIPLFSILGYLAGLKGFRLAALIAKYLYVKKPKKSTEKGNKRR